MKLKIDKVAANIEKQLKDKVPVRTGRLKNSIRYQIEEKQDCYIISFVVEDYFKWLKERKKPQRLPSAKELNNAKPPLPKMNNLGKVKMSDLSRKSRGIFDDIDFKEAFKMLDIKELEKEIKEILAYDKL